MDVKKLRQGRAEQAEKLQAQQDEAHQTDVLAKTAPVVAGANGIQQTA